MAANEKKLRTSLYVGDLHPDVTEKDLADTFSRVAPLLSVHLCRHKSSRRSLCYAYVNFWLPCHAFAAMKCLNHAVLKGKQIRVMWNERNPNARNDNSGNLFVKNLDKSITSSLLQKVFSKYGTVVSCKVAHESGISKGFGFVQFDSEDSAIAARTALHDTFLAGKNLYVSKFMRKNERNDPEGCFKSLYVKNIDEDITEDVLKAKFSQYGKVINAVIMRDEKGKSKGFGYVNFDSHEAAKRAREFLNGEKLGFKSIFVARAMKRSELRKTSRQMSGYASTDHSKESRALPVCGKESTSDNGAVNSAMPVWNYATRSRVVYTSFSCPCDTNKALKSVTGAQLHIPCEKLPPQPVYAADCQQSRCNFTYFSCPAPFNQPSTPLHSTVYQYFASRPLSASYSAVAQSTRGTFNAFPKEIAAVNGYMQEGYLVTSTAQKLSSPVKLGVYGDGKALSINQALNCPKETAAPNPNGSMREGYLDMPKAQKLLYQLKFDRFGDGKAVCTNKSLPVRIMTRPICVPQQLGSASMKVSMKMAGTHTEKLFESEKGEDRLL